MGCEGVMGGKGRDGRREYCVDAYFEIEEGLF